jgi:hypothetical protein
MKYICKLLFCSTFLISATASFAQPAVQGGSVAPPTTASKGPKDQTPGITCVGQDPRMWDNCVGTYTYPNGNKYTGEYKNGRRDGKGTIRIVAKGMSTNNYIGSEIPSTYVGDFRDDRLNGHGVWTTDDGKKIEGDWVNNIMTKKN